MHVTKICYNCFSIVNDDEVLDKENETGAVI